MIKISQYISDTSPEWEPVFTNTNITNDIKVGHPSNLEVFKELSFQLLTWNEIIRKYVFDVYYIFYLRVP